MLFVSLDTDAVMSAVDGLKDGTPRAIARALNRGIKAARTSEVRNIASDTGLKQADVRSALSMTTATTTWPQASLSAGLKRIPLIQFKARDTRSRGVSYALQGGRGTIADAFIATMASGHDGVFRRAGRARLPIKELFGPSIGHVFLKYKPEAVARAEEIFVSNFEHEISFNQPVPSDLEQGDAGAE